MNDALSDSMFWVGALFAFTPIVVGGTAIAIWWWMRKRSTREDGAPSDPGSPGAAVDR